MHLDFQLSPDTTELRIVASGRIDDDRVIEAYRGFWAREGRPPLTRIMSDYRLVEGPGMSANGLRRLAEVNAREFGQPRTTLRCAIVAPDDLHFGLAGLYAAFAQDSVEFLVTRDLDEAEAWLAAAEG